MRRLVIGGTVEADAGNNAEDDGGTENATALIGRQVKVKIELAMADTFRRGEDDFIVSNKE